MSVELSGGETPSAAGIRTLPEVAWSSAWAFGRRYDRALISTPWLGPDDDLATVLQSGVEEIHRPDDTVFVSEKVAVLLTGHAVPADTVQVGRLARWVAAGVRPVGSSRGLSVPEKLQYVLDHTGTTRVLMAALSTAVTRPFGKHGTFYEVAGTLARDLDGMRPPYEGLLLPPLDAAEAMHLSEQLEARIGAGVAIVDINDRGGSVRAASSRALPPDVIYEVLRDNPLGQRDQSTPLGLIRAHTAD